MNHYRNYVHIQVRTWNYWSSKLPAATPFSHQPQEWWMCSLLQTSLQEAKRLGLTGLMKDMWHVVYACFLSFPPQHVWTSEKLILRVFRLLYANRAWAVGEEPLHPAWVQRQQTLFHSVDFVVLWMVELQTYFLNDLQGCSLAEEHKNSVECQAAWLPCFPHFLPWHQQILIFDSPSSILERDCSVQITELNNQYLLRVHVLNCK